jgi:hypothetical protein
MPARVIDPDNGDSNALGIRDRLPESVFDRQTRGEGVGNGALAEHLDGHAGIDGWVSGRVLPNMHADHRAVRESTAVFDNSDHARLNLWRGRS